MAEFLLELLSEEIPARMQPRAAEDLRRPFAEGLGGGFAVVGPQAYAHFGRSVAAAGDVNGDGQDDLIVGMPHYDLGYPYGYSQGGAVVIFGKPGFEPVDAGDVMGGTGGFGLIGAHPYDQAGYAVAGVGDHS